MKILFSTDGSDDALEAVAFLKRLQFPTNSDLKIMTVVEELEELAHLREMNHDRYQGLYEEITKEAEVLLLKTRDELAGPQWTITSELHQGHVTNEIISAAESGSFDMVVMGSRGLNRLQYMVLGSTCEKVIRLAPASGLVVRPRKKLAGDALKSNAELLDQPMKILVAADGSAPSQAALRKLASLPLKADTRVHVIRVESMIRFYRQDLLQRYNDVWKADREKAEKDLVQAQEILSGMDVQITTELHEDTRDAAKAIASVAADGEFDLVVMGNKGKSNLDRFLLGSVSLKTLRYAPCSVWIVKE